MSKFILYFGYRLRISREIKLYDALAHEDQSLSRTMQLPPFALRFRASERSVITKQNDNRNGRRIKTSL